MLLLLLGGCTQSGEPDNGKTSIVCTIFPVYDWTRQILGDETGDMELSLLLSSRIDLHNYQPSVTDIVKLSSCDLFVYVGGESDRWVDNAIRDALNPDMLVIDLLQVLGDAAKTEVITEEMDGQHVHGDGAGSSGEHGEEIDFDEHVWLSLNNARVFCIAIADALSLLDADNADTYQRNLAAYVARLSALENAYREAVNAAQVKTLLVCDRFPFRYLVDDYGIDYYAAFPGCSAESEASFETIITLARKVDELELKNLIVTESADRSIAETIISSTREKNQRILVMDSMQSVTSNDALSGLTYLSMMESNLSILKEALKS